MIESVFLVEELVEFCSEPLRQTLVVCSSVDIAKDFIGTHGGDQMVLTATGEILPKYKISEYRVISHSRKIKHKEVKGV